MGDGVSTPPSRRREVIARACDRDARTGLTFLVFRQQPKNRPAGHPRRPPPTDGQSRRSTVA